MVIILRLSVVEKIPILIPWQILIKKQNAHFHNKYFVNNSFPYLFVLVSVSQPIELYSIERAEAVDDKVTVITLLFCFGTTICHSHFARYLFIIAGGGGYQKFIAVRVYSINSIKNDQIMKMKLGVTHSTTRGYVMLTTLSPNQRRFQFAS